MSEQKAERQPNLISLGSINADFQLRVDRRPEPSETLVGRDFLRLGGGKAANVAFLARKLGHPARLFGHVGDDELAEQAVAPLRLAGIDVSGVTRVFNRTTGLAMITVPPDGKKGIVLAANANEAWSEDDPGGVITALETAADGTALVVDCEVPAFVVRKAAQTAQRRKIRCVLDPSPADRVNDELLRRIDVIVPNATEAEMLTGIEVGDPASAAHAGRRLLAYGPQAALLKLPDGGCVVAEETGVGLLESAPVDVIDTTGAGDAFAGALAVALMEGRKLTDAARWAVAAAACAVQGYGSQPAYPDRRTLEAALDSVTLSRLEQ